MDLDPTTFVLEIINFLVLLWLLAHFLWKPMRHALEARAAAAAHERQALDTQQRTLDQGIADLARQRSAAETHREEAERTLAADMAVLREKRMAELNRDVADEREKARARLELERAAAQRQGDEALRARAGQFVAGYLERLASPDVESAIVNLFLSDLEEQSDSARAALRDGGAAPDGAGAEIDVATAFAPEPAAREKVQAELERLVGPGIRTRWRIDSALLAGICIHLPGHQLEASLRRGIDAFAADSA